jgi:membrane protease YdiL (CAAX protease family)
MRSVPPLSRTPLAGPDPSADRRPSPACDLPPWAPWTGLAALTAGFGLWLVATAVVAIVAQSSGSSLAHPTHAVNFALSLAFDLGFVAAALFFAVGQAGGRPPDFGYRRVGPGLAVGALVAAGLSYYGVSALYASVFHITGQDKVPNLGQIGTPVFVCLIAPIAEELFFRGFMFGALRRLSIRVAGRDVATVVAAVITGLLFGLAHGGSASPQYLIPLGLLGFILCLVRWGTGSLYPCMALHSVNNSLALGVDSLHWNAGEILALMVGSVAVIAALTGPLAGPRLRSQASAA